jgi:DNA-binding NarL/FixJ family response regulator
LTSNVEIFVVTTIIRVLQRVHPGLNGQVQPTGVHSTLPNMPEQTRILIVEDHPLFRDALLGLLRSLDAVPTLYTASTLNEARTILSRTFEIDIVICDWRLPDGDGLDFLGSLGKTDPTIARVLISGTDDPRLATLCMDAGLMGYFPKSLEPSTLKSILEKLIEGDTWFPARSNQLRMLSIRQTQILDGIAAGKTNKHLARDLGITERTVKHHLTAVFERLGTTRRAEAVSRAVEQGLIQLPRH